MARWVAKEAQLNTHSQSTTEAAALAGARERTETLVAAFVAFIFGVGLVYTTGFSNPTTIHNAAHDTRHALSFPCH